MVLLEVKHLTKTFINENKKITVLENINFEVNKDEFLAIVGPSGCGKSTLLRIIGGLERYDEGEVLFHGKPIFVPTPEITMIFQQFGLLPWKTVLENIELPMEIHGIDKKRRRERALHFIKDVELDDFKGAYPYELSGGMKQRVGIARALALGPEILLMDEPFSSLDALTAESLRKEILDIWNDKTNVTDTFIMVTHSIDEAVFMADRVIVLTCRPGKIIADVKIDIPRPRQGHERSKKFFDLTDKIKKMITRKNFDVRCPLKELFFNR
jgi:NitT/TauT family transport system ATP-binding protein